MRVVSLLPSATEIVYALGCEPVATSHECDHPPAAHEKPSANRSRIEGGTSAEINEQVAVAEEEGVYELDYDVLRAADPDLILTQGVCEVCAVDHSLVERAVDDLDLDARILSTHPHSLEDVLDDIRRIGDALGRGDRARDLVGDLRDRIDAVRDRTTGIEARPRVAVLDWTDPVMVAGHWVPGMIELAGGEYGMADPGERSRPREWWEVREYDPEVIVAAPCGFSLVETLANLDDLRDREGWADLAAVREGRVYAMDGHAYLNRPGPRLVDSLEYLAGLVRPDRFERPPDSVARRIAGAWA